MSRISFLNDILSSVLELRGNGSAVEDDRSLEELSLALLSARGEVSGNQLSRSILDGFAVAAPEDQLAFFCWMLNELDIDSDAATKAIRDFQATPSAEHWELLNATTEPPRLELLRRINRIPEATERLVRMRETLRGFVPENKQLDRLDADFERLFKLWFNRGFLVLREIDWRSPANILEKIIQYEAVHEINDWQDLRGRLQPPDRKCFAFFHPVMPDEPLIFVEVAMTGDLPESIQSLLTTEREMIEPHDATDAVFYSISNCQPGLRGVSFGNFLIKHVATELAGSFPNLKSFRTLSPVPSLMSWASKEPSAEHRETYSKLQLISEKLVQGVSSAQGTPEASGAEQSTSLEDSMESEEVADPQLETEWVAASVAETDSENSVQATEATDATTEADDLEKLAQEFSELAARYLVEVKRADSQPRDPVARFHLGNGASLDAVLPLADLSKKGLAQSAGVMVSYLYDLDKVISQHEAYAGSRTVAHSKVVARMLAGESVADKSRFRIPGLSRSA